MHLIPMSGSPLHSSSHLIPLGGSKSPIPTSSLSPSGVITVFAIRINQLGNVIIFFIVLTKMTMMPFPTRDYDVGRILIQPFMQRELEPLISMGTLLGKKPFIRFSLLTSSHFCPKPFFFFKPFFFLQIRTVHRYKIYRNGKNYFLQIRIVRSEPLCPDFCQGTLQSLNLRFWGKIEQNWCLRRIKDGESSLMRTDSHSERIS